MAYVCQGKKKKKYFLSIVFITKQGRMVEVCVGRPKAEINQCSFVTITSADLEKFSGGTE